jgi:DnaB-like helicase N terminal domain/AAA domain
MTTSICDAVAQTERALLGSILFDNSVWPQTDALSAEDFASDAHRRIYRRMAAMFEDKRPVDIVTLTFELSESNQLQACGDSAYLASLLEHALPENFAAYVRRVTEAARNRRYEVLCERLVDATDTDRRLEIVQQIQASLTGNNGRHDWRKLFHSYEDVMNAPPARFAIDGFLQEEGITLLGGLAGHGKTLCMLSMVRALLEGGKLFGHFPVTAKAERVIYLIPEAGLGPFASRLKTFHLEDYIRDGRLFCRTLSSPESLLLTDPRLLDAVKGADLFLDTAVRFMIGDENSATEQKLFADMLFGLQRSGARTITGAHHSPKSFGKDTVMTLENVLRGSGDIGAMLCTCWGLSQIDATSNRIFVQNVKARDFSPCEPFIIQGRPSIDETGYFCLTEPPAFAGSLSEHKARDKQTGRPTVPERDQKAVQARELKAQGASYRKIAKGLGVSVGTVSSWLSQ